MGLGLAALAGSTVSSIANAWSQRQTNKENTALAREQMQFQERMSSTAHQRQIQDLKAAGLNPILSASYGGASSPSGASAQLQAPEIGDIGNMISSSFQAQEFKKQTEATTANLRQDNILKKEDEKLKKGEQTTQRLQQQEIQQRTKQLNESIRSQQLENEANERMQQLYRDNPNLIKWEKALGVAGQVTGLGRDLTIGGAALGSIMQNRRNSEQRERHHKEELDMRQELFNREKTKTIESYGAQGEHLGTKYYKEK